MTGWGYFYEGLVIGVLAGVVAVGLFSSSTGYGRRRGDKIDGRDSKVPRKLRE